ncbi:TetM/TetW/TetO/TetS family tetracycline resistance ribosomal protection protein [Actinoallomurus purpureus]|uniref:elongation factor G n=1 Tax=Actinoallomurus purpureus TaxID=478114 RepID=UPI002093B476|nr:TetM/TetW/TetO/TetS family tetracycline resistance ribosomal protection protein [Actinoallomurus purpureus]MCO6007231.1 TetM/TetW/TetO/TetS family tetracycline resistance ribosomal protection protein [Actinoallomurus purpureus]
MTTLNIGVLAHVDAGKTTLTERLLFHAGVIDEPGSVDRGTTQTDSMELERRRGITIRSAVVSFTIDDLKVNLIDTPGHSDFISEVERAVRVLDGAVLVVSAVEGVQAQTRVLMRVLTRLRIPTLIFVNKIDRMGARHGDLVGDIARRLTHGAVAMSTVTNRGTRDAATRPYALDDAGHLDRVVEVLADTDDSFLTAYVRADGRVDAEDCRRRLVEQTGRASAHPVFFGAAATGVGVADLVRGIREFLPPAGGSRDERLSGTVFKIERDSSGRKAAYVRLRSGSIGVRERVTLHRGGGRPDRVHDAAAWEEHIGKVTALQVFDQGGAVPADRAGAGDIVKLWGLKDVRIGDRVGGPGDGADEAHFAPPALETVVRSVRPSDAPLLHAALQRLAEQDPLINIRVDDLNREISVLLYGEVQKEVLKAQLEDEEGIAVTFDETRVVYLERLARVGVAVHEIDRHGDHEVCATAGFRIEPAAAGTGVRYRLEVEPGSLPAAFHTAIEDSVRAALRRGPHGWEVTDCVVTLTHSGYESPVTTAGDFRTLTPRLLERALRQAGTHVCEPVAHVELEVPSDLVSGVSAALAEAGGTPTDLTVRSGTAYVTGVLPLGRVYEFGRRLPGQTRGEGVFLSEFAGHRRVEGAAPRRPSPVTGAAAAG